MNLSCKYALPQNHLLAALPEYELAELLEYLEPVWLTAGTPLYQPGEKLANVYFPSTAIVSMHYVTEAGATVETASVGTEGVVGVALFMGGGSSPSSAVVQSAGQAWRLNGRVLKQAFQRSGNLRLILLRFVQSLMAQITLAVACNCHHSVEQRLSRWLLGTLDRSESNELVITQEFVASILGVRREGITVAAGNLQRAGLLTTRRGRIVITDRAGLEGVACSCYAVLRKERTSLLRDVRVLAVPDARVRRASTSGPARPGIHAPRERRLFHESSANTLSAGADWHQCQ